jgi:hypothetical protein
LEDQDFAKFAGDADTPLDNAIRGLSERAVAANSPYSDNTSVTALRWHGA